MKDIQSITEVASLLRKVAEAVEKRDEGMARAAMQAHWLRMWRLVQGEENPES